MARLATKTALITGAAAGIGNGIAALFAQEGARVFLADVDGERAAAAAQQLTDRGFVATAMTVDVTRGQDVTAMFQKIKSDAGALDVVVNNAGLNVRTDFRHMSDADWVKIRELNLDAVVRVARDGFELLKGSGAGSLINISSIMGRRGLRQLVGYSTTKGAVTALTRALAIEYAPFGIRVNSVAPGFVETALTERVLRNPMIKKALLDQTPLRRFGQEREVAQVALFFASDESSYVTGAELAVDGGMAASL